MNFNALFYESQHFEGNFSLCVVQHLSILFVFVLKPLSVVCCIHSFLTGCNFLIRENPCLRTPVLWKQPPSRTFFSGKCVLYVIQCL